MHQESSPVRRLRVGAHTVFGGDAPRNLACPYVPTANTVTPPSCRTRASSSTASPDFPSVIKTTTYKSWRKSQRMKEHNVRRSQRQLQDFHTDKSDLG